MLFPVLSRCLGWMEGAAAVEAVLAAHGSFAEAVAAPAEELEAIPALGIAGAAALKAIHAAALQLAFLRLKQGPILRNMTGLLDYLQASGARGATEQLRVLFLDPRNRLIADETMGEGDVRGVAVFPGRVLRRALALHASALILVHNHPSGDATPSEADVEMTARLMRAAAEMEISLHDHIIVTGEGHSSFRRLGLI
jgi:DNA repair protein RadC